MINKLKISVVTVCYNVVNQIDEVMQSILNQDYENIEYIIDGSSKDETIEIIKRYADGIFDWMSEMAKGIYDAMNKGIKVAKGDCIHFTSAGDTFLIIR